MGRKRASNCVVASSVPTIERNGTTSRCAMPPTFAVTSVSVGERLRCPRRANQHPIRAAAWARRARRKSACASRTGLPVACATAKPNTSPAAQAGSLPGVRTRSRFATHSGLPAAVIGVVMIGGSRLTIVVMEQRGVGSHRENGSESDLLTLTRRRWPRSGAQLRHCTPAPWNTLSQAGRCVRVRTAWMTASTAPTTTSGCPLGERCTKCPLRSAMA